MSSSRIMGRFYPFLFIPLLKNPSLEVGNWQYRCVPVVKIHQVLHLHSIQRFFFNVQKISNVKTLSLSHLLQVKIQLFEYLLCSQHCARFLDDPSRHLWPSCPSPALGLCWMESEEIINMFCSKIIGSRMVRSLLGSVGYFTRSLKMLDKQRG